MDDKKEKARRRRRIKDRLAEIPLYSFPDESCSMCRDENLECVVTPDGTSLCKSCVYAAFEPTQEDIDAELSEILDQREENLRKIMWEKANDPTDKKPN